MKHVVSLSVLMAAFLTGSTAVNAAEHSLSLGYTQAKLDSHKTHGADIKYRYEWDSPWSVIGSFSYQTDNTGIMNYDSAGSHNGSTRIKSSSLMAGPAWRFNEFFSLYGMAGINKFTVHQQWKLRQNNSNGSTVTRQMSDNSNHLSPIVSVGTRFNPLSSVVLDLSYALSRPKIYTSHRDFSYISLGAGIRF